MPTPKLPWKDAIRILRKRREFLAMSMGEDEVSSIQAFLAWRAFAVVARGTTPEARQETNQCQELARHTLPMDADTLLPLARQLAKGLSSLSKESTELRRDWYCLEGWEQQKSDSMVAAAKKRVTLLCASLNGADPTSPACAYNLGEEVYAIRNAVIAHARIHTTGNLFQHIVPPFGALCERMACAGIALRAGCGVAIVVQEVERAHA